MRRSDAMTRARATARARAPRTLVDRVLTAIIAVTLLGFVAVLVGGATGTRLVVIESGSMTPTLLVGDLIATRSEPATAIRVGQLVTFQHPQLRQPVTHRVVAVRSEPGWIDVTTKGDANTVAENWRVPAGGAVGRMIGKVPGGAFAVRLAHSRLSWVALIVAVCVGLGHALLSRIWAPPTRPLPSG